MKFFSKHIILAVALSSSLLMLAPLATHAQQDDFANGNPGIKLDTAPPGYTYSQEGDDLAITLSQDASGLTEPTAQSVAKRILSVFLALLAPFMFIAAIAVLVVLVVRHKQGHPGTLAPQIPVELLSYIKKQIAAGYTEQQIHAAVEQGGWDAQMTALAFDAAYGRAQTPVHVQPMELAAGLGGKYVHSYKKIGAFMVAGPIVGIVAVLILYALTTFVFSTFGGGNGGQIVMIFFSFLGLVTLVSLAIGIPLGIPFFVRRDADNFAQDLAYARVNPIYKGLTDQQIVYILDWSWAAFFGSFLWPIGEKLYLWAVLSLLSNVFPLAPFVIACMMGREGRKMAWEKGWPSFQDFRQRQSVMAWVVGICVVAIPLVLAAILLIIGVSMSGQN